MDLTLFHSQIELALEEAQATTSPEIDELTAQAGAGGGLDLRQAAKLLLKGKTNSLIEQAIKIKEKNFGQRVALFAPLYFTNICKNNCLYCGFRFDNKKLVRRQLTLPEIRKEAKALARTGHRIVLLICGENPHDSRKDYLSEVIKTVRSTPGIARVNLEVAPLSADEYAHLKEAGAGTYILFQETYHPQTYKTMHPSGAKANFENRINAPLKAVEAGFTEVGLGILLGLRNYHYDFLGLVAHAREIKERFGFYPSSFSLPRLKPALDAPLKTPPAPISDLEFQRLAALLRLVFPEAEIILTTREAPPLRDTMMRSGVSMFSAGSRTHPGGYSEEADHAPNKEQFSLDDVRSLDEIVGKLVDSGELPSFQEAVTPSLARPVSALNYQKNALLSFSEYLTGHASALTCKKGTALIRQILPKMNDELLSGEIIRKLG